MKQRRSTEIYHEVVGIHVQFLRVQLTELGVGGLDVVQVFHGSVQPAHDDLTMSSHFRVAHDSGGAGKVTKGSEVPLSPGSHDQEPENREEQSMKKKKQQQQQEFISKGLSTYRTSQQTSRYNHKHRELPG